MALSCYLALPPNKHPLFVRKRKMIQKNLKTFLIMRVATTF